jgi:hypothetical protein
MWTMNFATLTRRLSRRAKRPAAAGAIRGADFALESFEARMLLSAVMTDKQDYAFGETAVITGSGFAAGELVQLQVQNAPGYGTNDDAQNQPWTVNADDAGNVASMWVVDDPAAENALYILTAQGLSSGESASTTFTDSINSLSNLHVGAQSIVVNAGTGASPPFDVSVDRNGGGDSITYSILNAGTVFPSGVTFGFSPNGQMNQTSTTLTITTQTGTPAGEYTFTVRATGNSKTADGTGTLKVGTPTTTTLTTSGTPSTYGDSVTFTATVSGGATPTGSVQFKDGATNLGSAVTLSGGSAALNTSALSAAASPHSITAVYIPDATHNASTSTAVSQAVNPRPVAVTGSRVYDGTTNAAAAILTITNKVGTDTVNLTGSGTLASRNVGSQALSVGTLALSGSASSNYTLVDLTGSVNVTQRAISVTPGSATKIYDTNTTSTGTPQVVSGSIAAGDSSALTQSYSTKTVGTNKPQTAGGVVNDGNGGNNYSYSFNSANIGTITAAPLTVTGVSADSRVYNATQTATLSGTAVLSGVLGTDDVSLGGTPVANFNNKNVGVNKPVTVTGYTRVGGDAVNYRLTQPTGLTANITVAPLTVTGITANNKVYDGNATATLSGTAALSGKFGGDVVNLGGSPTANFADKHVGTGKPVTVTGYTAVGGDASNYAFTQPTGLAANITVRSLTIQASANTKTYDGNTTSANTPSVSGIQGTDSVSGLSQSYADANAGTGKTIAVDPGYVVNDGNGGNDYSVSLVTSSAGVINKANQTITWNNPADITYGTALGVTQLNATVAGVAGGSGPGGLTYTPAAATVLNAGAGQTLSVTAAETANYNPATANVTINVNQAALFVTADNKVRAKGAADPATSYTVTGLIGSDTTTGTPTVTMPTVGAAQVGVFPISIAAGTLNAGANYNVTFVPGKLTVTGVQINDGEAQRSMIRSIKVTFATPAAVAPTLGLTRRTGGAVSPLTSTLSDGNQTITYTFATGSSPALIDGIYDLTATAGPQTQSLTFHRLFGDSNGDKRCDAADIAAFAAAMKAGATYQWYFDNDNDNDVDVADYTQARARQGKIFTY